MVERSLDSCDRDFITQESPAISAEDAGDAVCKNVETRGDGLLAYAAASAESAADTRDQVHLREIGEPEFRSLWVCMIVPLQSDDGETQGGPQRSHELRVDAEFSHACFFLRHSTVGMFKFTAKEADLRVVVVFGSGALVYS